MPKKHIYLSRITKWWETNNDKQICRYYLRRVPPSAPGISATGISAPIGAEVPVAEIPGAEGRTHYLWSIRRKIFHN